MGKIGKVTAVSSRKKRGATQQSCGLPENYVSNVVETPNPDYYEQPVTFYAEHPLVAGFVWAERDEFEKFKPPAPTVPKKPSNFEAFSTPLKTKNVATTKETAPELQRGTIYSGATADEAKENVQDLGPIRISKG
jgi:hypothetical protein